ncbi:MAG: hypothetical protein QJR00_05810 [Bacillota bacterium]|nr:hypothetical protein [Bacillota bacterium]
MKETLKAGFLVGLVILSFYLSWRLFWPEARVSPASLSGTPILFQGSTLQIPPDLFSPYAATDWEADKRWTADDAGVFPEIRTFFRRVLAAVPVQAWREAAPRSREEGTRSSLDVMWLTPVSLAAVLWEPGETGCREGEDILFSRVSLRREGGVWVLGLWQGDKGREVVLEGFPGEPENLMAWLSQQPGEVLREAALPLGWPETGPLALPATLPEVAAIPLRREEFPSARSVAEAFFPDMAVVRRIDLGPDQVLFTDREATLRLDQNLQYEAVRISFPSDLCLAQAISRVDRFVGGHGGWPEEPLLLWKFQQEGGRFHVEWGERVGFLPAVDPRPALGITLDDQGVKEYGRRLFRPLPLLPGQKGLKVKDPVSILHTWSEEGGEPFPVEAILLVLRPPGDPPQPQVLVPYWLFVGAGGPALWAEAWTGTVVPNPEEGP